MARQRLRGAAEKRVAAVGRRQGESQCRDELLRLTTASPVLVAAVRQACWPRPAADMDASSACSSTPIALQRTKLAAARAARRRYLASRRLRQRHIWRSGKDNRYAPQAQRPRPGQSRRAGRAGLLAVSNALRR